MSEPRWGVLVFHPANVFGGAERTMMNLLGRLDQSRFRIVLVGDPTVFRNPPVDTFHAISSLHLAEGFTGLQRTVADARTLTRLARREHCTVLLGMLHYGAIVTPACRFFSLGRLKTIASPRTPTAEGIRFHVGSGSRARLWDFVVRMFCLFSNRVLVASQGLATECIDTYGASARRVRVVPNSVDDTLIARARKAAVSVRSVAAPDRPWRIVTSGRLAPEKDIQTLLRAFAIVRSRHDALLEIIGSGTEKAALEAMVAHLGIADSVVFAGFVSNPLERIGEADLFIHTALFEGFGNVLLEAMACAVPVVATDCDFGPREIIRDDVNGRLVRVSDPDHLAEVTLGLLADAPARKRLVTKALEDVADYGVERMVTAYEQVFQELAG